MVCVTIKGTPTGGVSIGNGGLVESWSVEAKTAWTAPSGLSLYLATHCPGAVLSGQPFGWVGWRFSEGKEV